MSSAAQPPDPGFHDHFSAGAELYASGRPRYPAALSAQLAALAPGRFLAWDAGCGSGQLSLGLADHFQRVIATDASAAQIARGTAHPRIEYRVERAESPDLRPHSVDLCVAAQAVHWFDVEAWHRAVARVGRPAGLVAMVGYGRVIPEAGLLGAVDELRDGLLGRYWPPQRAHVESGYRDLPFPWPAVDFPPSQIALDWDFTEFCDYVATWSSTRALRDAGRGAELDALLASLRSPYGPARRRWRWPILCRCGRLP